MFNLFFKKERLVEKLIYGYLKALKLSQENFSNALNACLLSSAYCENFDFFIKQTHKFESKADDIIEEINNLMYGKALLPESRGDIMTLLAEMDKIPNSFDQILHIIQTQKLHLPEFLIADLKELLRISLESCDLITHQVTALFKKTSGIRSLAGTIDTNESHCDHWERKIITQLFESDIAPFEKLQVKELIVFIGNISDQADNISRLVNIIHMKRRV